MDPITQLIKNAKVCIFVDGENIFRDDTNILKFLRPIIIESEHTGAEFFIVIKNPSYLDKIKDLISKAYHNGFYNKYHVIIAGIGLNIGEIRQLEREKDKFTSWRIGAPVTDDPLRITKLDNLEQLTLVELQTSKRIIEGTQKDFQVIPRILHDHIQEYDDHLIFFMSTQTSPGRSTVISQEDFSSKGLQKLSKHAQDVTIYLTTFEFKNGAETITEVKGISIQLPLRSYTKEEIKQITHLCPTSMKYQEESKTFLTPFIVLPPPPLTHNELLANMERITDKQIKSAISALDLSKLPMPLFKLFSDVNKSKRMIDNVDPQIIKERRENFIKFLNKIINHNQENQAVINLPDYIVGFAEIFNRDEIIGASGASGEKKYYNQYLKYKSKYIKLKQQLQLRN